MVFSSHIFLFYFLPVALLLYYGARPAWRHLVLTVVSYVFYGWWNPWFMLLMLGSTIVDYLCGKAISADGASAGKRKTGLFVSVIMNLAVLAFFKYAGFGADTVASLSNLFGGGGFEVPDFFRNIVLPVGISFYTFQSMSYSIDLYRGHAVPARNFTDFACYVSMFPQLVAGPIVRYGSVADQLQHREHTMDGFALGATRFSYGFAKKILLANPMGGIADVCFGAGEGALGPAAAWIGVIAYSFQIYFDFSAYSDMAIGLGRMFGFRFPENFDSPYRSKSITEFWRRWHISLSSFLRDYLYIPLGGNRKGNVRTYVNLMTVMLLGGLWHGAQWTFIAWGAIHGGMLAFERLMGKDSFYAKMPSIARMVLTFVIVLITWVFFRAENFEVAGRYLAAMFGAAGDAPASALTSARVFTPANLFWLALCSIVVWGMPHTYAWLHRLTPGKAIAGLALLAVSVMVLFTQGVNPFLYFQF